MQLKIITTLDQFNSLASEWNQLLTTSATNVPFMRHEYLSAWWHTLGGGEWPQGELYIVIAQTNDGHLLAAAPLFLTNQKSGERTLMFLGSYEISDYLDFISPADQLAPFLSSLFAHLCGPDSPAWDVIDLYNILDQSNSLNELKIIAGAHNLSIDQEVMQPAPHIALASNWEDYLSGLQGKQRREIRRKMKRAATHFEPVNWYIVEQESTLDEEINAFFKLMAYAPEKDAFLTKVMISQMRSAVHTAFQAGWLQLAFIEIGGEKAAAYLNFDYDNKIWVYNSGINWSYRELSPGWVLLGHLIQWAIDNGRSTFDMMRGDEVYKYRFGGVDRFVMRVQIRPSI
ncbi:MAG: GNAT family N-acetyltransferase [Anaerolineae bacterium]|nr:GNAT family N-acetyltransferase [Anaerolineae bacterium]